MAPTSCRSIRKVAMGSGVLVTWLFGACGPSAASVVCADAGAAQPDAGPQTDGGSSVQPDGGARIVTTLWAGAMENGAGQLAQDEGFLYVAADSSILKIAKDGGTAATLAPTGANPGAGQSILAVNSQSVFFTRGFTSQPTNIQSVQKDGTGLKVVVANLGSSQVLESLQADDQHVYWANFAGSGPPQLQRADLDGSNGTVLHAGPVSSLVLDGPTLFWTDPGGPFAIDRIGVDGTGFSVVVAPGPMTAGGLVFTAGADILWEDTAGLHQSGLDGTNAQTLSFFPSLLAMVASSDDLYFVSSGGTGIVGRTSLDGSSPEVLATSPPPPSQLTANLVADGTNVYWLETDGANAELKTTAR